eukprot:gb/GEZN01011253.1/.p1 GENE.gb/GEZN01011253.1/~~gb/GEZN01011253.1/.p1  ORF type:complete len:216 (-),score=15.79 gb/GEZN01011253.1/:433-1080(-)
MLVVVFFLLLPCWHRMLAGSVHVSQAFPLCLTPQHGIFGSIAIPEGKSKGQQTWRLCSLEDSTTYETRVSYLGTAPFQFQLQLFPPNSYLQDDLDFFSNNEPANGQRRRQADIEKVVFSTNYLRLVVFPGLNLTQDTLLALSIEYNAVSDDVSLRYRPTDFYIVLEPLAFGVFPPGSLTLIGLFFAIFSFLVWCIKWLRPAFESSLPPVESIKVS